MNMNIKKQSTMKMDYKAKKKYFLDTKTIS